MYSDGTEWHVTEKMESDRLLELTTSGSGAFSVAGVGDITNMSKTVDHHRSSSGRNIFSTRYISSQQRWFCWL